MGVGTGDIASVVGWLVDGAPTAARAEDILQQLCERIAACGIPLWRVSVFVRTLHPNLIGRRFSWHPEKGIDVGQASFEILESEEFRSSPVVRLYETEKPLRRRLCAPDCPNDFAILQTFRDDGITDYIAAPLRFTNGEIHAVTWTTRAPDGFSDEDAASLARIAPPLARLAEIYALRRTARTLLDTYVGAHAGERILKGQIRRGDTDTIHAAIWLSDMRGFTALADRIAPASLTALLNRFFDAQVPAIERHGGAVLKFIGDGLLAIFPLAADDGDAACAAALDAAREARAEIAALEAAPAIEGVTRVRFGLALHVGAVLYGNIGGPMRLDFTCVGPAINLAARLEKLAGELGRTLVASADFAARCRGLVPVGQFAIRGLEGVQRVFGLPEEAEAAER
jgi:adenylate cyclase